MKQQTSKTLLTHWISVNRLLISTRLKNALLQQRRAKIIDNTPTGFHYEWHHTFKYLEDISQKEFLKGRSIGVRTWRDFIAIRDNVKKTSEKKQHYLKLEFIPIEDMIIFADAYKQTEILNSDNDTYRSKVETEFVIGITSYANFYKREVKLSDFIECDSNGKIMSEHLLFPANMEGSIRAGEYRKEFLAAREKVVFDLPLKDSMWDSFNIHKIKSVNQYLSLFNKIAVNPKTMKDLINHGLIFKSSTAKKLKMRYHKTKKQ